MSTRQDQRISVGPISGFPEWSPAERIAEQKMLDTIRAAFERYGFSPIETPSVERNEVLTAKGGSEAERQIYRLTSLYPQSAEDAREYSLHFDLTVPLARYVAQHYGNLVFPFRRYQIQKVWRGERPQHGRFREFTQCDIDIIGDEKLGLMADAEIPAVISEVFTGLDIGPFQVRVSNRKILTGFLLHLGIDEGQLGDVLREVDKIERQGTYPAIDYLNSISVSEDSIDMIIEFVQMDGSSQQILSELSSKENVNEQYEEGVQELSTVVEQATSLGMPEENLNVDLSIVRGLDYYTGTVYETRLVDHPNLGSICSGGRYDDLANYFINRKLPGVGISIGLTRLFSQLLQAGIAEPKGAGTAQVLVTRPDESLTRKCLEIASNLRGENVNTEVFLENARLGRQLRYASRKGLRIAVIPNEEDLEKGSVKFRDLEDGAEYIVKIEDLATEVQKIA